MQQEKAIPPAIEIAGFFEVIRLSQCAKVGRERSTMPKFFSNFRTAAMVAILVLSSLPSLGQNPQLHTKNGNRFPTVIFTFAFWNANPSYYSIAIDSAGASTYLSAPDSLDRTGVPYSLEFQASDHTRRMIFNVARESDFFRGQVEITLDSAQKNPIRTLGFHDVTYNNQITFTESVDPEIQELTSVFEEISSTLEFGRRLASLHQHDKGGLEGELAAMQKDADRHWLRELQAVSSVLRSISTDPGVTGQARAQADRLLRLAH
jgi:hypothetical protein